MFKSSTRLAFTLMTVLFRVRDAIWPPEVSLRELGLMQGHTLLDFGCGPGSYSIAGARLVGPAGRIYAVDINPLAVKRVQKAATRRSLGNISAIGGTTRRKSHHAALTSRSCTMSFTSWTAPPP